VTIHARADEHAGLRALVAGAAVVLATGPPPEGSAILRTDRIYDPARLRRAIRRGRDPESAAIWRLDGPAGLAGAEAEWARRRTYQPIGRFWAIDPARRLARALAPTAVRPNAVTIASAALVIGAAGIVAAGGPGLAAAAALAVALVLDTADGHLARLQGTASEFGRWLDAWLDELGDMALHAGIAWAAFARDRHPGWLLLGMAYAMGKYQFVIGSTPTPAEPGPAVARGLSLRRESPIRRCVHLAGHADVRWHLWIVLAALGRLDLALAAYAAYFPARALAGAIRKGVRRA